MGVGPRFGPAGRPVNYTGRTSGVPKYLHSIGLDAFEYQAVRWGDKPKMSRKEAERLRLEAKHYDVRLSMHASYFINFGDRRKVDASLERLLACLTAACWIDAYIVVFHPGYYKGRSPEAALQTCIDALRRLEKLMDSRGIKGVYLGVETTGRSAQLGSLEEVVRICEEIESARPVVDWAHLHARDGSASISTKEDYLRVLEIIEGRLGSQVVKNLHVHFSKIEFTRKGERKHHPLDAAGYGPDFRLFAEVMVELGLAPVIICETPLLDIDAVKMRDIYLSVREGRG
ncbi:MAG TPA: deoxyribonuclease IV [Candidatus Bathyarchaeota archaeon]|nr:deoxyribonuclease IV [Candidatus Bathyarchaeota archaeon]